MVRNGISFICMHHTCAQYMWLGNDGVRSTTDKTSTSTTSALTLLCLSLPFDNQNTSYMHIFLVHVYLSEPYSPIAAKLSRPNCFKTIRGKVTLGCTSGWIRIENVCSNRQPHCTRTLFNEYHIRQVLGNLRPLHRSSSPTTPDYTCRLPMFPS